MKLSNANILYELSPSNDATLPPFSLNLPNKKASIYLPLKLECLMLTTSVVGFQKYVQIKFK